MEIRTGAFWGKAFSSLRVPNYRLYFTGQSISLAGTWMQMTAQSWLVLTLTHSSTDLGLAVALQADPGNRCPACDDGPGRATRL